MGVNPRRSTQRAAFHLGSRYTATRCAPRTRGGPRRNCSWCATCGDGARLTQRPGLRAFVGREEPLRCSEVCGFPVTPRSFFLPLSRRIPILRDQMIPAVLLHYLKVVVFSFFFPSLTFCVCVCVCIPVSHERLFGSGVRSRLHITRRAARQRRGGQQGVSELAGKPWLGCLLGSAEADEPLEMDRACPAH